MNNELLGLAFAAGLVAALNPCGFAMLPAYLTFVVSGSEASRPAAVARALLATLALALGFLAVFAAFGVLTVAVASTVQKFLPFVTVVVGVVLVSTGIWLLAGRQLYFPMPAALQSENRATRTRGLGSMFSYGAAYATASLSCTVGPFLAVTGAGLRSGSVANAVAVYVSYAAGFVLIVGTLAVAAAFASSALVAPLQRVLPVVNRLGGALVILVGLYVTYYGIYELRLFHGNASPEDAVISAAGRLQATIAGWVNGHGGWPWLIGLVVLLSAVAAVAWRRRVRNS
jgi:cytochrome c biogenesis protein CcdA